MDRARASAIGVILTAVAASGLLWLVPGVTRDAGGIVGRVVSGITSEDADAQVKAAMDALEAGINQGNADLALAGFATGDAAWLAQQREQVTEIIARAQGRPVELHYAHPSWWGHYAGGREVVSRRVYAGPTVVVDTVSGEIAGEIERYAIAPQGRFELHPFPKNDEKLRIGYAASLGGFYAKLGHADRALEVWEATIDRYGADHTSLVPLYEAMARTHAGDGNAAAAHEAYGNALRVLQTITSSTSYTNMQFGSERVRVLKLDELRLRLAETASAAGDVDGARRWYGSLSESETSELADLAAERLSDL